MLGQACRVQTQHMGPQNPIPAHGTSTGLRGGTGGQPRNAGALSKCVGPDRGNTRPNPACGPDLHHSPGPQSQQFKHYLCRPSPVQVSYSNFSLPKHLQREKNKWVDVDIQAGTIYFFIFIFIFFSG